MKRDDRRTSHGRADGRSMLAQYVCDASRESSRSEINSDIAREVAVVGSRSMCAEFAREDLCAICAEIAPEAVARRDDAVGK